MQYLKMRLKYHKEIVSYLSKRAQIGKMARDIVVYCLWWFISCD